MKLRCSTYVPKYLREYSKQESRYSRRHTKVSKDFAIYARSKVDYVIGEFIYMLPSDMNLRIGKVKDYKNKILILSPSFKIGTNAKISLDVKSKEVEMVKTEPDVKPNKKYKQDAKPNIKFDRESNQDVKEPDTNKITYEEEKVALILGTTAVFTVWWMFK